MEFGNFGRVFRWWKQMFVRRKMKQKREEENNFFCMKSDEIDQITAPPHPSRTATRCLRGLRVPRRNSGISDIFHASRTTEESQAHLRDSVSYTVFAHVHHFSPTINL
ncbi:hypothetical protein E3N88_12167 [Mikania micrantha]|uniref:Uncharacterized protein n=1 Tax=Mikania micrantha TaxID=192012 RepID=A0A5N6P623_9ASTR|nr:hypothetical protein E3N88_12167 [Mikania micrantha]